MDKGGDEKAKPKSAKPTGSPSSTKKPKSNVTLIKCRPVDLATDKQPIDVNLDSLKMSKVWCELINSSPKTEPIPISLNEKLFKKIIDYCDQHNQEPPPAAEDIDRIVVLEPSDIKYFEGVQIDELFELIKAAHQLSIDGLVRIVSKQIADTIKGKSVEEVRSIFQIEEKDIGFTPEELTKLDQENDFFDKEFVF